MKTQKKLEKAAYEDPTFLLPIRVTRWVVIFSYIFFFMRSPFSFEVSNILKYG